MKRKYVLPVMATAAAAVAGLLMACGHNTTADGQRITKDSLIKRGNYLVTAMGCNDCHTPKVMTPTGPAPDTGRLLSGHRADVQLPPANTDALKNGWALFYAEGTAMISPMGTSYAANITSDETGIGNWTLEQFKTALTKGKWKGMENSRDLLPPMPWENYRNLSNADVEAIFTYLKSTKPVNNLVPAPQMAYSDIKPDKP